MQTQAANIVSLSEYRQARTEKLRRASLGNQAAVQTSAMMFMWMPVWFFPVTSPVPSVHVKG